MPRVRETATVARFNAKGDLIYLGTSTGMLHVVDTQTKMVHRAQSDLRLWLTSPQLIHSEKLSAGSSIKHLEFDRTGSSLVIASNDRVIRVYAVNDSAFYAQACSSEATGATLVDLLIPRHRFQDLVNRTPWNAVRFSNDGEYVVAGAGHKAAHQIYLWDCTAGNLSKILEGPKDPLADLDVGGASSFPTSLNPLAVAPHQAGLRLCLVGSRHLPHLGHEHCRTLVCICCRL